MAGRLFLLGAVLFTGAAAFAAGWATFELVALRWTWLRQQLGTPVVRPGSWRGVYRSTARINAILGMFEFGYNAWTEGKYAAARGSFLLGLEMLEELVRSDPGVVGTRQSQLARELSNIAWFLATCPDETMRDGAMAVGLARWAIDLEPLHGNTWNTLGAALYRSEDWDGARDALSRAMERREGGTGTAYDWYLMAMVEARAGDREQALGWFQRAANMPNPIPAKGSELERLRIEAAGLLGLEPRTEPLPVEDSLTEISNADAGRPGE
jgi:tetratricopeptide (TPR) repeat protein